MRYTLEIQKLMNRAEQENIHPKDAAKLLVSAIQIADANDDIELGYELRSELMDKEFGLGGRGEFVNAFSWMLNAYDAEPDNYPVEDLLWKYKWIIDEVHSNPEIPLDQISQILDDYKRRVEEQGIGLRSYYSKLLNEALYQEDEAKSKKYLELVNSLPIDDLSDCRACEMDAEVSVLIVGDDFKGAYEKAQPLMKKQFSCAHVPVITSCQLCYSAVKAGEMDLAAELFVAADEDLQDAENDSSLVSSVAMLIVYLFHTDKEKGWQYLEKYLPWTIDVKASLQFFSAMHIAEALKQADQDETVTLELPEEHPLFVAEGMYVVKTLYQYYFDLAESTSRLFDARNGNENFSIQLKKALY